MGSTGARTLGHQSRASRCGAGHRVDLPRRRPKSCRKRPRPKRWPPPPPLRSGPILQLSSRPRSPPSSLRASSLRGGSQPCRLRAGREPSTEQRHLRCSERPDRAPCRTQLQDLPQSESEGRHAKSPCPTSVSASLPLPASPSLHPWSRTGPQAPNLPSRTWGRPQGHCCPVRRRQPPPCRSPSAARARPIRSRSAPLSPRA
mmetsp:Transcript_120993/g.353525  ORF Transcript_120993/g.353525 Transcript_120993/m.353525 type:complete len:202 (+) Transcript_120993:443-1048(+)